MKRITFFAAFIVALVTFNTNKAKAQVSAHIGINIGRPAYYAPAPRVVVVDRPVVYHAPVRRVYYNRPVVVRHGYYAPRYYSHRPVVVHQYRGNGRGHGHGHGRW